jgi:hypothetical protein
LLAGVDISDGVRLLGVSVANLVEGAPHQMALAFEDADGAGATGHGPGDRSTESTDQSWHNAARAVDLVRARFGAKAVGPAVLLQPEGLRLKRQGDSQWGPVSSDPERSGSGP